MSAPLYVLNEKLYSPPFSLDLEKNMERIGQLLRFLSNELTRRFYFDINIEPMTTLGGYKVVYDLFGIYSADFKRRFGIGTEVALEEKYRILKISTGRSWRDLCRKMENIPKKYPNIWFIKDEMDKKFVKSNINEVFSVLLKIPEKEITTKYVNENLLFTFNLGGFFAFQSPNFEIVKEYATEILNTMVHRIFNIPHPVISREQYQIPQKIPVEVSDDLEQAISCYGHLENTATVTMVRRAFETLLSQIYIKSTGKKEPVVNPVCPHCKSHLGSRPMGVVKLSRWAIEGGYLDKMYEQRCRLITDLGAAGAHPLTKIESYDADLAIRTFIIILKELMKNAGDLLKTSEI